MVGIIQRLLTCINDVVQLLTKLAIREKRMLVLVNQRSWEDMGSEVKGPRNHTAETTGSGNNRRSPTEWRESDESRMAHPGG